MRITEQARKKVLQEEGCGDDNMMATGIASTRICHLPDNFLIFCGGVQSAKKTVEYPGLPHHTASHHTESSHPKVSPVRKNVDPGTRCTSDFCWLRHLHDLHGCVSQYVRKAHAVEVQDLQREDPCPMGDCSSTAASGRICPRARHGCC